MGDPVMNLRWASALLVLACGASTIRAEHADIDLRLFHYDPVTGTIKAQASSTADTDPPLGGVKPRPLVKVKANEPLALQFIFINTYPHNEIKDVTVHYFVVQEEKAGQKRVPALDKGVVTEGHYKLNFKPKTKVGARVAFTITKPGFYLLRLQTENTKSDHEHFSAIDIQVE
jgi:hypothetical protein